MISEKAVMRVARPTDHLSVITRMYIDGLGFVLLSQFADHDGIDGAIIGHPQHNYHLEFTQHAGSHADSYACEAPSQDHLLVFYLPDEAEWQHACENMQQAGFLPVRSANPFWDVAGKTFVDADGYRVVLQNRAWSL